MADDMAVRRLTTPSRITFEGKRYGDPVGKPGTWVVEAGVLGGMVNR
jgi:hypothetical protein